MCRGGCVAGIYKRHSLAYIPIASRPPLSYNGANPRKQLPMKLHDPLRPTIAGHPALLLDGCAVPRLQIFPRDESTVEVAAMLRCEDGEGHRWFKAAMPYALVAPMLYAYQNDPELTLKQFLSWEDKPVLSRPKISLAARVKAAATLEAADYADSYL
jgi:hypothetical protein